MPGDQQNIRWVFDLEPASGARSGGDVASRAFTPSLDTFVREVLQNSKDAQTEEASKRGVPVEVRFKLIHLTGENFEAFKKALGWSSLEEHLMEAIHQSQGQSIEQALEELLDKGEITLLRIDDYNTSGLTGSEFGGAKRNEGSRFASLCKDKLYSAKSSNTAGGSHGMGKAVLWRFSGLSTVLFNSTLESVEEGKSNPRFIGRTSLPWHRTEKNALEGPGWFGKEQRDGKEQYFAKSLWGKEASQAAGDLYLHRENGGTGTSILVADFREPAEEDRSSLMETAESIRLNREQPNWAEKRRLRDAEAGKNYFR